MPSKQSNSDLAIVDLYVDQIAEMVWNKQAFRDLVVDEETKELVQALVTEQLSAKQSTDSIEGKGNGLVILLHGGPGTGKTFTAEGVAEFAEKPLLRVTCGDIGTQAEVVEKRLQSTFHLGKIWDCGEIQRVLRSIRHVGTLTVHSRPVGRSGCFP